MKILIAYDGSESSDAAIVDLKRAGLPAHAEIVVLSVAEVFPQFVAAPYAAIASNPGWYAPVGAAGEAINGYELAEAQALGHQATERLTVDFPGWKITPESWIDGAAEAIARKAHAWKPDLLVIGSHGRTGFTRLVLGSVSRHVVLHTKCSVRISRHHLHAQDRPIRFLVAVDGSEDSSLAVQSAATREWPQGTEARVIAVMDSRIPMGSLEYGAIATSLGDDIQLAMTAAAHQAVKQLSDHGLSVTHQVLSGRPSDTIIAEAEKCSADSIFVGAHGLTRLERTLLGSVSTDVASRAHCSVEVVRRSPAP